LATEEDIEIRLDSPDFRPTRDLSDADTDETYVDARSLSLPWRYLQAHMPGSPDITVQARWKNYLAGTPRYNDCYVSVTLLYNVAEGEK
jgi:hypothetical protein